MSRRNGRPQRRVLLGSLLGALLLVGIDLARPPEAQVSTRALLASIDLYQVTVSPRLRAAGGRCRFRPTCSLYGEAVIRRHGALVGGAKAAWRILRCGPWTPAGTEDPPGGRSSGPSASRQPERGTRIGGRDRATAPDRDPSPAGGAPRAADLE